MKPSFDIYDRFKGKYVKPESKKDSLESGILPVTQDPDFRGFWDYQSNTVVPYNQMSQGDAIKNMESLTSPEFQQRLMGHFETECIHDPVDVGFLKPKMVCKKCDKDL